MRLLGQTCVSNPFETTAAGSCGGAGTGTLMLAWWLLLGRCSEEGSGRARLFGLGWEMVLVKSFMRLIIDRMLSSMFWMSAE